MYKRAKRENRVLFFKKAWLDFHFGLDILAPNTSPKEKIENPSAPVSGRPNGAISIRTAGRGSYWWDASHCFWVSLLWARLSPECGLRHPEGFTCLPTGFCISSALTPAPLRVGGWQWAGRKKPWCVHLCGVISLNCSWEEARDERITKFQLTLTSTEGRTLQVLAAAGIRPDFWWVQLGPMCLESSSFSFFSP